MYVSRSRGTSPLQGNRRHTTSSLVAYLRRATLGIRPIRVAFAWSTVDKQDVIHETGSTCRIATSPEEVRPSEPWRHVAYTESFVTFGYPLQRRERHCNRSSPSVRPFLLYLLNQLTSEPDFCMRAGRVGLKITAVCWTTIYCGVLQVLTDGHSSRFPL